MYKLKSNYEMFFNKPIQKTLSKYLRRKFFHIQHINTQKAPIYTQSFEIGRESRTAEQFNSCYSWLPHVKDNSSYD